MPEIEIRPAQAEDIPYLVQIDHDFVSDYVWQMDIQHSDEGQISVQFRQVRLPRSVKVEYPRFYHSLQVDWEQRDGLLVALHHGEVVGYISLALNNVPLTTSVTDLAVVHKMRHQGIATALILSAGEWARQHACSRLVLEIQPKNYPAIRLAKKLSFDFCGFNDRYYPNLDIALFFAKSLR